jgi:hypothetical protein
MATSATGAALETAAVETAVTFNAVVAAEGGAADRCALSVGGACAAEGDIAAPSAAANRLADAAAAIEPTAALRSGGAAAALIAAAVESTVTGDPIVVAEDGSSRLAAFARLGALPAETDGAATTTRGSADPVRAAQTAAADGVAVAPAAVIVTAVQNAVGVNPVRCADRRPRSLAALAGLRTLGAECQPAGAVIRADPIHAVKAAAASSAVVASRASATLIAAAVQGAVAVIAIVGTDSRSTALTALCG